MIVLYIVRAGGAFSLYRAKSLITGCERTQERLPQICGIPCIVAHIIEKVNKCKCSLYTPTTYLLKELATFHVQAV